jgi:hypothetical protein
MNPGKDTDEGFNNVLSMMSAKKAKLSMLKIGLP